MHDRLKHISAGKQVAADAKDGSWIQDSALITPSAQPHPIKTSIPPPATDLMKLL
jgi:hypothetical protein